MTSRVLPAGEWSKLAHTDFPAMLPYVTPEDVQIVVVEDADRIVGCWAVMRITHLEGLWIDPAYRGKASVGRRLLTETVRLARSWSARWVWTGAQTDDVRAMLAKVGGVRLPLDSYVVPLE